MPFQYFRTRHRHFAFKLALSLLAFSLIPVSKCHADQRVILKSGLTLQGFLVDVASLNQSGFQAGGAQGQARPILLVDDGLRRVYIHRRGMVAGEPQDVRGVERTIEFKQLSPVGNDEIQIVGDIISVSDFNEYARRNITILGHDGPIEIVQGITELNARYAKLEALKSRPSYKWDMRVATRSIRPETFQKIFRQRIDQDDLDARLMVVRFFMESERYRAAEDELTRAIRAFPELEDMKAQLSTLVAYQGERLLDEADLRARAGQPQFARSVYSKFPMDAVGRTMRERVKIAMEELDSDAQQVENLVQALRGHLDQLAGVDPNIERLFNEIREQLSSASLPRLSDYARLKDSNTTPVENKVALALAGWLMGPGSGESNLIVVTSLVKVRDLVGEYLGSANLVRRQEILSELKAIEGSQIEYVARLIEFIGPVQQWPEGAADDEVSGFYRIGRLAGDNAETTINDQPDYLVQLPPEYDPRRQYPCLVVLPPPNLNPELELNWWAGDFDAALGGRAGHAMRNGYIVVAPMWGRPTQRTYEYTPREHDHVLKALRHAMRHTSIDPDRVFLAGHDEGGTAAWDIAVSHPDLWAGVVCINPEPSKTLTHYSDNARLVPMYLVMGEASGPKAPLVRMGAILDRHMHVRNDVTVVMYRGRGKEDFYEEMPEIFKWLNVPTHVRKPIPREIDAVTMRRGDQFFWWLELGALKPLIDINPILWDQTSRIKAGKINSSIGGDNQVRVDGPCETFQLWLRPDIGLDLSKTVVIRAGSTPQYYEFDRELETILEDTRRRADRKRPFWATVRVPEE
ncbi:alpha/beta hydrolase [Stieleria sp. JC731]|uniref:alpha/beta hydrolase n=1 Tax=Pirellulaceae TaxID=2691357 RepID=UPI001E5DBC45|nr:alpha/beta hydrolase [Stieleria sp. JC731]MCC9599624.1 alpha/beta hydrolase [Stieleria sp. JC731]